MEYQVIILLFFVITCLVIYIFILKTEISLLKDTVKWRKEWDVYRLDEITYWKNMADKLLGEKDNE